MRSTAGRRAVNRDDSLGLRFFTVSPPIVARYSKAEEMVVIPGARDYAVLFGSDENLHVLIDDARDVSLVSLRRALSEFGAAIGEDLIRVYFYALEPQRFEPDVSPRLPFSLYWTDRRFDVRAKLTTPSDRLASALDLLRVTTPLLRGHRAAPQRVESFDEFGLEEVHLNFSFSSLRGKRVRDVEEAGTEVAQLASAVSQDGELDAKAIEALVLAGAADVLVGQAEHQGFDAKAIGYDLSTERGRFELAKDVAAFGNGGQEGTIVCGLRARKRDGKDRVIEARPIRLSGFREIDWIRTIRSRVVPAPEGVRVQVRRTTNGSNPFGYIVLSIPTQPEDLKPFLINAGVRQDGKVVETDITVPVRIGEDTEYADAAGLHGLLTAGRAALRR
jgi:hypothetical protein